MNRISFSKVPFAMSAVLAASVVSGCQDCNNHGGGGPVVTDRSDAGPPPPKKWQPRNFEVDKYATPYAVAPAKAGDDTCAEKGSWKPAPPAPGQKEALARRPEGAKEEGFCVYRWAGPRLPTKADFDQINGTPQHALLGMNGPAEQPKASRKPLPKEVYEPLQKRFEKRASGFAAAGLERLKALESRAAAPAKAAAPAGPAPKEGAPAEAAATRPLPLVEVAIIDATPRSLGMTARDRSGHGFAVSRVVGTLACANPDSFECTHQVVVPYLALPIIGEVEGNFDEDWVTGGRTGTMVHLYDALSTAIQEWRKHGNQHLIINLSVGWDPIKLAADDKSVVRIRSLLESAWCSGALIVAAAGNFTGSPGPIYPAAFESLRAPTAARCQKLLPAGTEPAAMPGNRYAPLVHSVGAVDINDRRTLVNRRWGQPRLAALGAAVTVPGPPGMPYTDPMDGTSMSAAIVSGIAARIWAARPTLKAVEVMEKIYQGGVELKVGDALERPQTEYCMGEPYGPCAQWKVRRAYLCGAMAKALPGPTPACDQSLPSTNFNWPHDTPPPSWPPAEPCTLTECGIPFGPMENQLPAAAGGHGIGNCDTCTFHVDQTGLITLNGTPTTPVPPSLMLGMSAVLNTDLNSAVRIFPTFGVPMNDMPVQPMNPATSQASITWTVQVANIGTITSTSPLTPN
jgi:hypothetical protein